MTKEEYKERQKQLDAQYKNGRIELAKEYAHDNNPFQIGDIVSGNGTTIKITKLGYYISFDDPQMSLHGIELKKDLTPAKKQLNTVTYSTSATLIQKA